MRATLRWSWLTLTTPLAVLIMVGQIEQRATTMAELRNAFSNIGFSGLYQALTRIITTGSQASGETGLKT